MENMCESLRRHARRSAGVDLRDYTSLSGTLPLSNVLASLPRCLAPPSYRTLATGSLRDFIRSPSDLQSLADMFLTGDLAQTEALLDSADDALGLPVDFCFPFSTPLDVVSRTSAHSGRSFGVATPRQEEGVNQGPWRSPRDWICGRRVRAVAAKMRRRRRTCPPCMRALSRFCSSSSSRPAASRLE